MTLITALYEDKLKNRTFPFINRVCFPINAIDCITFIRLPRVICLVSVKNKKKREIHLIKFSTSSTILFNDVASISYKLMQFLQQTLRYFCSIIINYRKNNENKY